MRIAGGIHGSARDSGGGDSGRPGERWGANDKGELGLGTAGPAVRTPQKIPGLSGVTQLAAAAEMSMALRSDGTLLVWGYEGFGPRGDGIARSTPFRYPPR